MSLGSIVGNAVTETLGGTPGSSVEGFLSKFANNQGKYVDKLDPHTTFDVKFLFHPNISDGAANQATDDSKWYKRLGNSLLGSAKSAVSNLVNNATGGLVASLMSLANDSIEKQKADYKYKGEYSFLNYLAVAEMHSTGEVDKDKPSQAIGEWVGGTSGSPTGLLELDLSYYVQDIVVPQLAIESNGGEADTNFGKVPLNGTCIVPQNHDLTFNFLNTSMSLLEFVFYPWMREVTLPYWSYPSQPYTTATITIDFSKHADIQYVFCGCRPKSIYTIQPNQQTGDALIRNVTFVFDFMFVTSKKSEVIEQWDTKLLGSVGAIASGASNLINFS